MTIGVDVVSMPDEPLFAVVTAPWRRLPAWMQLLVFGVAVVALGLLSVRLFRPEGHALAIWWPVAGLGLVGLLVAERRQRPHVAAMHLVATAIINLAGGQDVAVAVGLGVLNAAQVLLMIRLLEHGGRDPRCLREPRDLWTFVVAITVGSLFVAVGAATIVGLAYGIPVASTVASLAPSHASALVLLGILPMRGLPSRSEASRTEVVAQLFAVTAVTLVVFWPGQRVPLVFLVVPVLLWGALRAGVRAVAIQLVTMGAISAALTLRAGGPFAPQPGGALSTVTESVALTQLFLVAVALIVLMTMLVVQGRREAMAELAHRDARARVAYERGLIGRLDLRPDGDGLRVVRLNTIAARFFDAAHTGLVGTVWCDLFSPEQRERLRDAVRAIVEGRQAAWHGELGTIVAGEERWFEVALYPSVPDGQGVVVSAQVLDVTDRRHREETLRELAMRDVLTGLANRMVFDDHLDQALAQARRDGTRVGLLFLDLDDFKPVNDRHGHDVGDQVLVGVARNLAHAVREVDTVARFGGDEFAVILPRLRDPVEADAMVERVRAAVQIPVRIGDDVGDVVVSASVGLALSVPGDEPRELLRRADEAMYEEKRSVRSV